MRNILAVSTIIILAMVSFSAAASEPVDCSAFAVNRQIDSWYNQFLGTRSEIDPQASMKAASDFSTNVEGLLDICGLVIGEGGELDSAQTGIGTVDSPFVVRANATMDFVSIRVTGSMRPADDLLIEEGAFPANIPTDMHFFITFLEFNCGTAAPGGCFMDQDSFRLIGDMGILYEPAVLPYSAYLPESRHVIGGGQRTGGIPFMVNQADTNFRLVYYPNGDADTAFTEQFFYLHAQGTQDTMEVYSSNPELLVRRGPGSDYTAIGAFRRGQTAIATGRSTDGQWIRVDTPEFSGWVSASYVTSHDDIGNLTVVKFE
jgi:hypothetical protein